MIRDKVLELLATRVVPIPDLIARLVEEGHEPEAVASALRGMLLAGTVVLNSEMYAVRAEEGPKP